MKKKLVAKKQKSVGLKSSSPDLRTSGSMLLLLSALIVLSGFYFFAPINAWDAGGHLLAAREFRDHLWPQLSGWNFHHFGGYPQGYFYPSLFHWLVGGVGKLIDLTIAFRLLVISSLFAIFFGSVHLLRTLGVDKNKHVIVLVWVFSFMALPKGAIGGDFASTMQVGLVSQFLATALVPVYLSFLILGRSSLSALIKATGLLALIICSHAFVTLATGILMLITFAVYYRPYSRQRITSLILHGLFAIIGASAWVIPYIAFREYQTGATLNVNLGDLAGIATASGSAVAVASALLLFFSFYVAFVSKAKKEKSAQFFLLWVIVIVTIYLVMFGITRTDSVFELIKKTPLHVYRLLNFNYLGAAFGIGITLANLRSRRWVLLGSFFWFALSFYIFIDQTMVFAPRILQLPNYKLDPDARTIVSLGEPSILHWISPHILADEIAATGQPLANGLFVESSRIASFELGVMTEMFNRPFRWGVYIAPVLPVNLAKHIRYLGIQAAISNEPLTDEAAQQLPESTNEKTVTDVTFGDIFKTEPLYIYRWNNPLVELLPEAPHVVTKWWSDWVDRWWTEDDQQTGIFNRSDSEAQTIPSCDPPQAGETVEYKQTTDVAFDLAIHSADRRWVYVKIPYFPDWKARDEKGAPIVIFESSPAMMAVCAGGPVHFQFEKTGLEIAAHVITLIFILLWLLFGWILPFLKTKRLNRGAVASLLLLIAGRSQAEVDPRTLRADVISIGGWHVCLNWEKEIKCWGDNRSGQLGGGTTRDSTSYVTVKGLPLTERGSALATGQFHSCALIRSEVYCWGRNNENQVNPRLKVQAFKTAVKVQDLPAMSMLAAGAFHTCAANLSDMFCWGKNFNGIQKIEGLTGFKIKSISGGLSHTVVVATQAEQDFIFTFGENKNGELGTGDRAERQHAQKLLLSGRSVQASTFRSHTCASVDAKAYCWGLNNLGQLNLGENSPRVVDRPTAILYQGQLSELSTGSSQTCGLGNGRIQCWGGNSMNQAHPDFGLAKILRSPQQIPVLTKARHVKTGNIASCAEIDDDYYTCWGTSGNGKN